MKMDGIFMKEMDFYPGILYILNQEIKTREADLRIAWESIISFILCDLVDFGQNRISTGTNMLEDAFAWER